MNASRMAYARNLAGVLLKDWLRFERALSAQDNSYLSLCNRGDRLDRSADGEGFRCDWQWTSELHAPKYLPGLGRRLMQRALKEHPIVRSKSAPENCVASPEISFVIGHRGTSRLPHLLATLESIAGQRGAAIECIVVEQECEAQLTGRLPAWVRHVHTPPPHTSMPYCRAWAFNVAAKHARSPVLVLHDNDLLVTTDYAANVLRRVQEGCEVVNLKRFLFYLDGQHSREVIEANAGLTKHPPIAIMQNTQGGGSLAITQDAYQRIGGLDESFVGWGGEDNEFWERAQSLRVWTHGYLPLVHLWHAAQAGKHDEDNETKSLYLARSRVAPAERITQLRSLRRGEMSGPHGWARMAVNGN
jgi:hypothetical protein